MTRMINTWQTTKIISPLICLLLAASQAPLGAQEGATVTKDLPSIDGQTKSPAKIIPPDQWWGEPSWSPDGKYIAVQSPPPERSAIEGTNGKISYGYKSPFEQKRVVLRASDYSLISTFDAFVNPQWSPNSKLLIATSTKPSDGNFDLSDYTSVIDAKTGAHLREIHGLLNEFVWSPESDRLLGIQNDRLSIYDLKKKLETIIRTADEKPFFQKATWSPDGKFVAASWNMQGQQARSRIGVWDAETGTEATSFDAKTSVECLSWSPNGRNFLYSEPHKINIAAADTFKIFRSIKTQGTVRFSWSPAQKQFLFQDSDGLHLLNAKNYSENIKIPGPANGRCTYSLSPQEDLVVVAGTDAVASCDAKSGKYIDSKSVEDLSNAFWTPDGKSVVFCRQNFSPVVEPVRQALSGQNVRVFEDGQKVSPGWENNPSPKNLVECFAAFDRRLSEKSREQFKSSSEEHVGSYGGGSFVVDSVMSDVYGSWGLNNLQIFFAKSGVNDVRDVIHIILIAYWRHLNAQPIDLKDLVRKHLAWWDAPRLMVTPDKKMPASFLSMVMRDPQIGPFSVDSVRGKLKIISFVDADSEASARYLTALQALRATHPSKQVIFIVFVIPPEVLYDKSRPFAKMRIESEASGSGEKIAAFRANKHEGIIVAPASIPLCREIFKCARVSNYSIFSPPQTLLVRDDGTAIMRLNGPIQLGVEQELEREIEAAKL